jgi:hypothetical protein
MDTRCRPSWFIGSANFGDVFSGAISSDYICIESVWLNRRTFGHVTLTNKTVKTLPLNFRWAFEALSNPF